MHQYGSVANEYPVCVGPYVSTVEKEAYIHISVARVQKTHLLQSRDMDSVTDAVGGGGGGRMARLRNKLMTGENKGDMDDNVLNVAKNLPLFIDRVEKILDGQVICFSYCSALFSFLFAHPPCPDRATPQCKGPLLFL